MPKLDPVQIDARHYRVEFENDQVRVIRARLGPHESVPLHEHTLNRVTVFPDRLEVRVTGADGKVSMTVRKAGEAIWSAPATHQEENLSDGRSK